MSDSLHLLEPPKPRKKENVIFRGKNFKTQFYGGSNPTSLIGDFPELRSFMQDSIKQHPSLPRVQRELKSLQIKWKAEKQTAFPAVKMDFLHLFPNENTSNRLIHTYLDTVETTYRIVHVPSFWKEYQSFRVDRRAARPAFVILMLLMMSTASCLSEEKSTHVGDSAVVRERAALWIEVSEHWLQNQSHKQIYLAIWQIRCLILLSKQVNVIKKKRIWTEAGTLLRQAMAAGFHRDPGNLGQKCTGFDHEMRRRLWATITELELQASIDRGMPSALAGVSSDCATVQNIDDDDLIDEADDTSRSKNWDLYTDSSYLHVSKSSFALRATLNSLVNNLGLPLQWEQVVDYEELVKAELESLPTWTRSGPSDRGGALSGITRLGTDFTRYWYISAGRSLLNSARDPSDETRQKQQAIEHVARQYHRIRGSQEDLISVKMMLNLTEPPAAADPNALAALYHPSYDYEAVNQTKVVDAYIKKHLIGFDQGLEHAYTNSTEKGLPMIAVSPAQGKFASLLTTIGSACNVLEIGTLGGYSSIWFAKAVKGRGKVTSIEISPHHRDVAVENLRAAGVEVPEEVEVLLGAGLDVLPRLVAEIERGAREPFDFVFIDADWPNQWNYFDFGVKVSKGKGAVIYIDNVVQNMLESGIVGENQRNGDSVDVFAKAGADDRVDAVVMQTVGSKTHDGFLLAVVK
ncbi:unnamed protein product [Penicillium pancosmium]